ncbi:MAG: regulatory iron-sulfur-containing complex subunit RicT [Planctomycetia bacterium]|nr:regulatory iron-sulfur-containing complex subunit RicT [Planctomycetia bacterium]
MNEESGQARPADKASVPQQPENDAPAAGPVDKPEAQAGAHPEPTEAPPAPNGGHETAVDEHRTPAAQKEPKQNKKQVEANYIVACFGALRKLGLFRHRIRSPKPRQKVILETKRGLELGEIVCEAQSNAKYQDKNIERAGKVLRLATPDDLSDVRHLNTESSSEFDFCKKEIAARNLPMKLITSEHIFGGDRIVFYFVSEQRIDFRELVRDVAREFRTRVEMRQVGVRDEARLLGDFERCGRSLCCRGWLKNLEPVSIKMAKMQKPTLDPAKISGRCGRLMCCLRFEDATYDELSRNLPTRGAVVETTKGLGEVVATDILSQIVHVKLEAGERISVPVKELLRKKIPAQELRKRDKT